MKQVPQEVQVSQAASEWELFDIDTEENLQQLLQAAEQFPKLL